MDLTTLLVKSFFITITPMFHICQYYYYNKCSLLESNVFAGRVTFRDTANKLFLLAYSQ